MSTFDEIRRLFDRTHRDSWENALSSVSIFNGMRLRIIATTPEKVMRSPAHSDLPEVVAQVIFSDETDTPRVTIDFYESETRTYVGLSYYFGETPAAGGFSPIENIEDWIAEKAEETAAFLEGNVLKAEKYVGSLRTQLPN